MMTGRCVAALTIVLAGFSSSGRAYQSARSATPNVSITPRQKAAPVPEGSAPEVHLRLDTSIALVPVQVTTQAGAPVPGLRSEDFRVFEDGARQEIRYFSRDDAPVSVGFLLDSSESMKNKKAQASEASAALFKTSNAEDDFFLIEFDEKPRLTVPFTSDTDTVYRRIARSRPFGRTSLYDAVHMALETMKSARHERQVLIILSDGGDNRSRLDFGTIRNDVLEAGVPIYSMGIFDAEGKEPGSPEEAGGPDLLRRLSTLTGGRHFNVKLADLPGISRLVGELIHHQYLLGYSPSNALRDGTYRSIRLELTQPASPVRLQYRHGYYAPSQ